VIRKPAGPRRPPKKSPAKASRPRRAPAARTAPRVDTRAAAPERVPPAPELNPRQLRELRARAHSLEPVVQVGHAGVNESVVRAVSGALRDHELIKVRLHQPEDKHAMAQVIAEETRAALCGLVGHTLILYKPRPKPKGVSGVARSSIRRNQPKPRNT